RASQARLLHEGPGALGKVTILRGDLITTEDRVLLQAAARAVLLSRRGSLAEQVERQRSRPSAPAQQRRRPATKTADVRPLRPELEFFNGLGGFAADGREYVTILS